MKDEKERQEQLKKHTLLKLYFALIGLPISILVPFFGIKCSVFFLIGFLLGVLIYKTVIIVKYKGLGNLTVLTIKHLLYDLLLSAIAIVGYIIGLGFIHLIKY